MSQGHAVDPELVKHAANRAAQAVAHFEKHATALKQAQQSIEAGQILLGAYGDAGVFYGSCERFHTVFNGILDTIIEHNDDFVETARKMHNGLQTASAVYARDDLLAEEQFRSIDDSYRSW